MIRRVGGLIRSSVFFLFYTLLSIGCGPGSDKGEWCTVDLFGDMDCSYKTRGQCMEWVFEGSPYILCQPNPRDLEPEEPESDEVNPEPTPTPT